MGWTTCVFEANDMLSFVLGAARDKQVKDTVRR